MFTVGANSNVHLFNSEILTKILTVCTSDEINRLKIPHKLKHFAINTKNF